MVFVLFREMLRNKIEKCSVDVSLDVFTERRVVPDDISLCVASRSCRLFVFVVVRLVSVSAEPLVFKASCNNNNNNNNLITYTARYS